MKAHWVFLFFILLSNVFVQSKVVYLKIFRAGCSPSSSAVPHAHMYVKIDTCFKDPTGRKFMFECPSFGNSPPRLFIYSSICNGSLVTTATTPWGTSSSSTSCSTVFPSTRLATFDDFGSSSTATCQEDDVPIRLQRNNDFQMTLYANANTANTTCVEGDFVADVYGSGSCSLGITPLCNATHLNFNVSSSGSCTSGTQSQVAYGASGQCYQGRKLLLCNKPLDEPQWWLLFSFVIPAGGLVFICVLFLRKNIIIALLLLLRLDFDKAMKALKINELFKLKASEIAKFFFMTPGRHLTLYIFGANTLLILVSSILHWVWRTMSIQCPDYAPLIEAPSFFAIYALMVLVITIGVMWLGLCFCSGFFFVNGEAKESLIHLTGIYDTSSKWYFKDPKGKFLYDIGSFLAIGILFVCNVATGVYGIILLTVHVNAKCGETIPLVIGILCTIPLFFVFLCVLYLIVFVILFLANCKVPKIDLNPNLVAPNLPLDEPKRQDTFKDTFKVSNLEGLIQTQVRNWTKDHITFWLKIQGLEEYISNLKFISIETLATIDQKDLYENGIVNTYHHRSILAATSKLNLNGYYVPADLDPRSWTVDQVKIFLKYQMKNGDSIVKKYALNGAYLVSCTDEELKSIFEFRNTAIDGRRLEFIKYALQTNPCFYRDKGYLSWNSDDVAIWLDSIGLPQYRKQFQKANVFGALLGFISTDDCLKELDVNQNDLLSLKSGLENISLRYLTLNEVTNWIRSTEIDHSLVNSVQKYSIHGALLLTLNDHQIDNFFPALAKNNLKKKAFKEKLNTLREKFPMLVPKNDYYEPSVMKTGYDQSNTQQFTPFDNIPQFNPNSQYETGPQFDYPLQDPGPVPDRPHPILDDKYCAICKRNEKCMLTIPCNHIALCEECAVGQDICPICQSAVFTKVKTFN